MNEETVVKADNRSAGATVFYRDWLIIEKLLIWIAFTMYQY